MKERLQAAGDSERPARAPEVAPAPQVEPGSAQEVLALQRSDGNTAVGAMLEQDASTQRALGRDRALRSPALLLRSQLRAPRLQRAVNTSGGEWDTDFYDLKKDVSGSGPQPAADNWRGADIKHKFKPNATVDAEEIGLVQSVQSYVAGAPKLTPGAAARNIPAADAQPTDVTGETDEGTAIDQSATSNNPVYAVESDKSTQLTDPVDSYFGENGWRYTDKSGAKEKTAWLMDKPRRKGAAKDSRQIFEVTALAIKGAQVGTYYGSVRWGWRTDGTGAFTKETLAKVTEGIPSSTFLKAGEIWNASKTPGGKDTVDLPLPANVKKTTGPVTLQPPAPMVDIALPVGTRVQVVHDLVGPMLKGTIKVIDGPDNGITGDVEPAEWGNIADER